MEHEFYEIEDIIDYRFKNRQLLLTALTHPSYANEHKLESYDRLEFVGDSILDFVIADVLYRKYRHKDEGFLTKMRASIVSREPLAYIVEKYNMLDYMFISGEKHREMGTKEISNLFESLVGAVYYDGGLYAAKKMIFKFLKPIIDSTSINQADFKSLLQEFVQERHLGDIVYTELQDDFNNNIHTYRMQVSCAGHTAQGEGKNKKQGEKKAAQKMLEMLKKKFK